MKNRFLAVLALILTCGTALAQDNRLLFFAAAQYAADQGNAHWEAVLAFHYSIGWDTEKNPALALKYATSSYNKGSPLGAFQLGAIIRSGGGVPQNETEGLELQKKSFQGLNSMGGNPYAINALGVMLSEGKVVSENKVEATRLYKLAADLGFAAAQFNFAQCLNAGTGISKNPILSNEYMYKALSQKYPLAFSILKQKGLAYGGSESHLPEYIAIPKYSKQEDDNQHDSNRHALSGENDGIKWEYKFEDNQLFLNVTSGNAPGEIIYADDKWIVKTNSYKSAHSGNVLFNLYFLDSRTLKLIGILQSPDELYRILRLPKKENFFAILVQSSGKFSLGPTPTLLLANPNTKELQAVALRGSLWRKDLDLDIIDSNIRVLVDWDDKPSFTTSESKGGAFSGSLKDVTYSLHDVCFNSPSKKNKSRENSQYNKIRNLHLADYDSLALELINSPFPNNKFTWMRRNQKTNWDKFESTYIARELTIDESNHSKTLPKLEIIRQISSLDIQSLDFFTLSNKNFRGPKNIGHVKQISKISDTIAAEYSLNICWINSFGFTMKSKPQGIGAFNASNEWIAEGKQNATKYESQNFKWKTLNSCGELWEGDHNLDYQGKATINIINKSNLTKNIEILAPKSIKMFPSEVYTGDNSILNSWAYYFPTGDKIVCERVNSNDFPSGTCNALKIFSPDNTEWPAIYNFTSQADTPMVVLGSKNNDWMILAAQTHTTTSTFPHGIYLLNKKNQTVHTLEVGLNSGPFDLMDVDVLDNSKLQIIFAAGNILKVLRIDIADITKNKGRRIEKLIHRDSYGNLYKINEDFLDLSECGSWVSRNTGFRPLYAKNSKLLFVPLSGGYEIYRLVDIKPQKIASIYFGNDGDFAVVNSRGFYAGSPGCETTLLNNLDSKTLLQASVLSPWRNRPAEVLKAIGGDSEQIDVLSKVTERWLRKLGNPERSPEPTAADIPSLTLTNDVSLWADSDEVLLTFDAKPGSAPVKNVLIRVNGVTQQQGANSVANQTKVTRTIKLAEGQNWIEAVAIDEKGRSSNLVRFRTILSDAPKSPKRYIIAVGVSKYKNSDLNLEFAAKDATDLAAAIKESTKGETEVLLLTNEQATKDAPAKIRKFLVDATENDEVVAFCAGHGVLDSNLDYVYASYDFDSANPSETGIKLDDLVDAVGSSKSLKRLLLLDTCHSGQVGEKDEMLLAQMDTELPKGVRAVKQRGMSVTPTAGLSAEGQQRFIEEMFLLPGLHRGINIIGASGGAEFALESAQWNNGVFTASIIEALREKKADLNEDGRVSVGELRNYLAQRVPELTKGAQKPSVVAAERDQDFDLITASYKSQSEPSISEPSSIQISSELPPENTLGLESRIRSYYQAIQGRNEAAVGTYFADQVDYYSSGTVPKSKVMADVRGDWKRYSNTTYSISDFQSLSPTSCQFILYYTLMQGDRPRQGKLQMNATLTSDQPQKIQSIKAKVISAK